MTQTPTPTPPKRPPARLALRAAGVPLAEDALATVILRARAAHFHAHAAQTAANAATYSPSTRTDAPSSSPSSARASSMHQYVSPSMPSVREREHAFQHMDSLDNIPASHYATELDLTE